MRDEVLRNRIVYWNLIVDIGGEILLCVVELDASGEQSGEVAVAHGLGENAGGSSAAGVFADALIVDEEEKLIVQDGATERAAEDGLRIWIGGDDGILVF